MTFSELTTLEVAALGKAMCTALDKSYAAMPELKKRLIRQCLLDQNVPWENMDAALRAALAPDALALAEQCQGGLASALMGPALVWASTQPWVPNPLAMHKVLLKKWTTEHVHQTTTATPDDRPTVLARLNTMMQAHTELMRISLLTLDGVPHTLPKETFHRMAAVGFAIGQVSNLRGGYNAHIASPWVHWFARTAMLAGTPHAQPTETRCSSKEQQRFIDVLASEQEPSIAQLPSAKNCWLYSVNTLFNPELGRDHPTIAAHTRLLFENVLNSSLPASWCQQALSLAPKPHWLIPHLMPQLARVLPRDSTERVQALPWGPRFSGQYSQDEIRDKRAILQYYLPDLHPVVDLVVEDHDWLDNEQLLPALMGMAQGQKEVKPQHKEDTLAMNQLFESMDLFQAP